MLAVREANPAWGGRKIRKVLERDGVADRPAASTITAILRRHNKLDGPRAGEKRDWTRFECAAPNELWQMDFKGHFALDAGRCHPLTVLDDHSRYALEIGACANEQGGTVRARLSAVASLWPSLTHPSPTMARPGINSGGGQWHTPLTVWLLDLGVRL